MSARMCANSVASFSFAQHMQYNHMMISSYNLVIFIANFTGCGQWLQFWSDPTPFNQARTITMASGRSAQLHPSFDRTKRLIKVHREQCSLTLRLSISLWHLWSPFQAVSLFVSERVTKTRSPFFCPRVTANDWFPPLLSGLQSIRSLARTSFTWPPMGLSYSSFSWTWSVLIVTRRIGPKQNGFALLASARTLILQAYNKQT